MTLTPAQAVAFIAIITLLVCMACVGMPDKALTIGLSGIALVLAIYFHLEVTK